MMFFAESDEGFVDSLFEGLGGLSGTVSSSSSADDG